MSASAEVRADTAFPHVQSGFSFENTRRNAFLHKMGGSAGSVKHHLPEATKTGTTIVGVCFKGGVVLGADTRATGSLVVDKDCDKIHYIADNIFCCGAGTAADTEMATAQVSSQLELLRLNSGLDSRVNTAVTMLKRHLYGYQGHVSAACVLGGVDITGPHLYTVYPHGSTDKLPFATMGSGSLAAMSVFESEYQDDLTKEQAMEMVCNAIEAGIFNDLGSGSNVDLLVIEKTGAQHHRSYKRPNDQAQLRARLNIPSTAFSFPVGTTPVESTQVFELGAKPVAAAGGGDAMDTA